jgi:hypothetical protein
MLEDDVATTNVSVGSMQASVNVVETSYNRTRPFFFRSKTDTFDVAVFLFVEATQR